jgi:hypothetical protein
MASSRWKRFAFFDRKNFKIPPPIFDDIVPANQNDRRSNSNNSISDRTTISENISLAVVNGAGIPYASLPDKLKLADTDPRHGVVGMANTLEACNHNGLIGLDEDNNNDNLTNNNDNNNAADSYQFSSTGQTLAVPDGVHKKNGNVNGSLVLAFVSSKSSPRVHCIDLTVRCNPIHESKASSSSLSGNFDGRLDRNSNSLGGDGQDMEDLDGWRGYFSPFAYDVISEDSLTTSSTVGQTPSTMDKAKIVAMAVCSDHETTKIKSGKNIYVACVTDSDHSVGVSVHRNPHLYLNDHMDTFASSRTSRSLGNDSGGNLAKLKATPKVEVYQPLGEFDHKYRGRPSCVEISFKNGIVAVGTSTGMVILYTINTSAGKGQQQAGTNGTKKLTLLMEIPAPPTASSSAVDGGVTATGSGGGSLESEVSCLKFMCEPFESTQEEADGLDKYMAQNKKMTEWNTQLFVTYRRNRTTQENASQSVSSSVASINGNNAGATGGGVCCYDLGRITSTLGSKTASQSTPTARYDLDGREVLSSSLCDMVATKSKTSNSKNNSNGNRFMVARSDGLYTYSSTDKITVSPIDGTKIAMCSVPPPPFTSRNFHPEMFFHSSDETSSTEKKDGENKSDDSDGMMYVQAAAAEAGASYALIATTDSKSGRDAVDIYDASNKLVAFHILLSPGHKALRAAGITTSLRSVADGTIRGGLSSAVVITTGGSLVTLTEKVTSDKVALLVQKNLYSAAISMAFADSSYKASDITSLFRRHAEHLYRKGDFSAAMDQYIYTIGSLEPSHVIFRFLDAPKIPLLAKYLEKLRARDMATSVHCELLKTCYLKLNDVNMAEKTSSLLSKSLTSATCTSLVSNLLHTPVEALATICSFEAPHAVEALKIHGSILARASPRECAGIIISLCDGVYSPGALANVGERRKVTSDVLKELLESKDRPQTCELYPVHLFSTAFMENPKLLRVILSHCLKNKRHLTSSLIRTLLELTLEEWNAAKRADNSNLEKTRRDEAMSILSDPQSSEKIGDYESLVIVQQNNFTEGEILLYEKLQMIPLLVEKYANEGTYKARRQMLALCRSDPEILGDVLGYFVKMATDRLGQEGTKEDDESVDSESELGELLQDVKEALQMARSQRVLPPVRIARILSGDGVGQFRDECGPDESGSSEGVPLSVALDYIGNVLDEQGKEIDRLQSDVEEYNQMCNAMEAEISELLSVSGNHRSITKKSSHLPDLNIDEMYSKLLESSFDTKLNTGEKKSESSSEEFWRAMGQAEDSFGTIARFFAKDIID